MKTTPLRINFERIQPGVNRCCLFYDYPLSDRLFILCLLFGRDAVTDVPIAVDNHPGSTRPLIGGLERSLCAFVGEIEWFDVVLNLRYIPLTLLDMLNAVRRDRALIFDTPSVGFRDTDNQRVPRPHYNSPQQQRKVSPVI
jgi:hypothetical protein